MGSRWLAIGVIGLASSLALPGLSPGGELRLDRDILPLVKARCIKCHGPGTSEAKLDLSTPRGIARGSDAGVVLVPGKLEESLLWQRVQADEMPPEDPLSADEKELLRSWIAAGAPGLPEPSAVDDSQGDHWAFRPLDVPSPPAVKDTSRIRTDIDRFILAELERHGLSFRPDADRYTLARRVSFDLVGLPPTPNEIKAFVDDSAPDAYERMIERYLASPHYGERWGKYWLDAAGYADSNGYFNADTDRPLAFRYRDYVVRSFNQDKPLDRFIVEQLAGDELAGFVADNDATPEMISLLEATHYLRNGQDGSGESDGNPDEVRADRYYALESVSQIVASSLLGLTIQCAKCHDHKFEPISQRDYYRLQSVFYPAFNIQDWIKPKDRFVYANLPGELERWQRHSAKIDARIAGLKSEFAAWFRAGRTPASVLFQDEFDAEGPPLADHWSATAPGDDRPGGEMAVAIDSAEAPGAIKRDGALVILESGAAGDRWISTRQSFDWTPDRDGDWIQASFDLVDNKAGGNCQPAERIAYFIALHDFDGNGPTAGGNVLVDGNPAGGAQVHLGYPAHAESKGQLGTVKYEPGHNFGVRVTRLSEDKFRLEHLIDSIPDDKPLELAARDLPDGGFGFEYCCARSFVVDNVVVERSTADPNASPGAQRDREELKARQKQLAESIAAAKSQRGERPGKIAAVADRSAQPPDVFLMERGNYAAPREKVSPAPLSALAAANETIDIQPPPAGTLSTGRRLAWARWLTRPGSRAAALLARVQANRIWQHHFGRGLVATSDNLGVSGSLPSHPELVEYLAGQLVRSGWSPKAMHRLLLTSSVYRQSGALEPAALKIDPDNRLLWRHPMLRLDAEATRDAMLAIAGRLDPLSGGPYVPLVRDDFGEVAIKPGTPGEFRRSIYLQQRRTHVLSFLNVFDSPSIVFNCVERPVSTMPLQSLSLLNSRFAVEQAGHFADRLAAEAGSSPQDRVQRAYLLALARPAEANEVAGAIAFVAAQREVYTSDGERRAWVDFCQMLLASNALAYVD